MTPTADRRQRQIDHRQRSIPQLSFAGEPGPSAPGYQFSNPYVSALSHDQAASADDPFLAVQPSNLSLVPLMPLSAIELQTSVTATAAAAVPGFLGSDNPFYVNSNQQPFQQMQSVQAPAQHLHHQPPFLAGSYSRI